jgi:hypothetical protein
LDTCEDISEISQHISDIFTHSREADRAYKAQQIAKEKEENGEVAPSETLQAAIDLVIHRKELGAMIKELEISLNYRWPSPEGEPTLWETILKEQSNIRAAQIKQRKEREKRAEIKRQQDRELMRRILIEGGKVMLIISFVTGLAFFLIYAYQSGPIR